MPFDSGGGGGTSLCNVSPTDQAGTIDNILSRLEALENAVANLAGTDVQAEQLSDISEALGWINDVTYLGTEGWTQTPSGTLIPPPGWDGLSSIVDGSSGTVVSGGGAKLKLHRRNIATSPDIATGTQYYVTVSSTPPSDDDVTFGGASYLSPGTDGGGNAGWEVLVSGKYRFSGYVALIDGTSAPTTGAFNAKFYKRDTIYSSFAICGFGVPPGGVGSYGVYLPLYGEIQLDAGDYVNLNVNNGTDGDLKVSAAYMIGTYLGT